MLCVFFHLNYGPLLDTAFEDLAEALDYQREVTNTFLWCAALSTILHQAVVTFCTVFALKYFYRRMTVGVGIVAAVGLRYSYVGLFLIAGAFRGERVDLHSLQFDWLSSVFLGIGLLAGILAAYAGWAVASSVRILAESDATAKHFYGISKKLWLLLLFAWNPVASFVHELTAVRVYQLSEKVTEEGFFWSFVPFVSAEGEDGLTFVAEFVFSLFLPWVLFIGLFAWGLHVIRDRQAKMRVLIILVIYVLIPVAILGIPLIRNKTWFF